MEAAERPEVPRAKKGNPIGLPSAEEAAARREEEAAGQKAPEPEGLASKDRYVQERLALATGGVAGLRTVRRWWGGVEIPGPVNPAEAESRAVCHAFPKALLVVGEVGKTLVASLRSQGWKVCWIEDEQEPVKKRTHVTGAAGWLLQQATAGLFAGVLWWARRRIEKEELLLNLMLEVTRSIGVRGGLVSAGGRRSAGLWEEEVVKRWRGEGGLRSAVGDACMLGADLRGCTQWVVNVRDEAWDCDELKCEHSSGEHDERTHPPGSGMDEAWELPLEELLQGWWDGEVKLRPEAAGAAGKPKRRAAPRNPWEATLGGLLETLAFKCDLAWRDKSGVHINVLETRARRRIASRISRRRKMWHQRHPTAIDPRVGQGATGKGRSSAVMIMRELQLALPDHLGADFQLNSARCESLMQPMDEPSRLKKVLEAAAPTAWEADVLAGRKPLVSREELKNWRRGLWRPPPPPPVRRLRWGYRAVKVGEATNPGPLRGGWGAPQRRRRARSAPVTRREKEKRCTLPPLGGKELDARTELRYQEGAQLLQGWMEEKQLPFGLEELCDMHPKVFNIVFRGWVKAAYKDELGREYVEGAILLIQRNFFWTKGSLAPTWRLVREWGLRHPYGHRSPAKGYEVGAFIATCFMWGWGALGFTAWITWDGGLRPGEGYRQREDTLKECAAVSDWEDDAIVAVIEDPKTRKSFARVQHAILEDQDLVRLLPRWLRTLGPGEKVWPFSSSTGGKRVQLALERIGCPRAWTMGGLRAGRAAQLWIRWRNLERLRVFMRHKRQATLEYYVQEAVVKLAQSERSPQHREWLRKVATMAVPLAERWVAKEELKARLGRAVREEFLGRTRLDQEMLQRRRRKRMKRRSFPMEAIGNLYGVYDPQSNLLAYIILYGS